MDTFTENVKAITEELNRRQALLDDYRRRNRDHERLIGELHELLKIDDIDGIRDLVEAEHGAIHGPST